MQTALKPLTKYQKSKTLCVSWFHLLNLFRYPLDRWTVTVSLLWVIACCIIAYVSRDLCNRSSYLSIKNKQNAFFNIRILTFWGLCFCVCTQILLWCYNTGKIKMSLSAISTFSKGKLLSRVILKTLFNMNHMIAKQRL